MARVEAVTFNPSRTRQAEKSVTFTGAANLGQAGTATTLFTVTGEILIEYIVGFCTVSLTEALASAVLSLGISGTTALFIPNTASLDIDANEFWLDTTPDPGGIVIPATGSTLRVLITENILVQASTQNTNGGTLKFYVRWSPMSNDGNLVAA